MSSQGGGSEDVAYGRHPILAQKSSPLFSQSGCHSHRGLFRAQPGSGGRRPRDDTATREQRPHAAPFSRCGRWPDSRFAPIGATAVVQLFTARRLQGRRVGRRTFAGVFTTFIAGRQARSSPHRAQLEACGRVLGTVRPVAPGHCRARAQGRCPPAAVCWTRCHVRPSGGGGSGPGWQRTSTWRRARPATGGGRLRLALGEAGRE